ncbi:MAG: metallophosphoesterase [Candidatus Thorarchaeota archaeon]
MATDKSKNKDYNSIIIPEKPAIVFDEKIFGRTLVVADLHIGYLYGKNRKGIIVPAAQSVEEDLLKLVEEIKCKRVIILGDFKDEIYGGSHPLAGRIWKFLRALLEKSEVTIIKGNHDGKIEEFVPEEVEIIPPSGLRVIETQKKRSIGMWHGHATPALDVLSSDITLSAHAHPAYSFREETGAKITEKVWVRAKWKDSTDKGKQRVHIIIPTFNRYIDGYSVDEELFETTVMMKEAIDLENAEVFNLEGVLIGTIGELKEARRTIIKKIKERRKELLKTKS